MIMWTSFIRIVSNSTAGDILTKERNRLIPYNAEKLLFCRENLPVVNFQY